MADEVKGILIRGEHLSGLQMISDEQRGKLIIALFADSGACDFPDMDNVTKVVFELIVPSVRRANNAYEKKCEANRANGRVGGRPKKTEEETQKPIGFSVKTQKPIGFSVKSENPKEAKRSEANINEEEKINTPHTPKNGELSLIDFSSASPSVCESPSCEKKVSSRGKAEGYSEDFERFWKSYPKRVNKGQAWKTWEKLRKAKELPEIEELCRAVRWRKIADDWEKDDGRYIPHPSTWLNAHGWEDEACKEPPDDPRNDPREEEAYKISNSMGGWAPRPEEYKNLRLYWERQLKINHALEAAGYGDFCTDKDLIAKKLGENK